jgi:N-6 DNA Methylase
VTENLAPADLQRNLREFVVWRQTHLSGDEKGEAQVFLDRLFRSLGHAGIREAGATLEQRIKRRDSRGTAFADLMWKPRCLIEMKKAGSDLKRHYRQAFDYWVEAVPDRPRYVILCNFDQVWIYDFDIQLDEPVDQIDLAELPQRWDALGFLLPTPAKPSFGNDLVSVTRQAAASVAHVFNLLQGRNVTRAAAQKFTLQSVMAMFAEDIGLLSGHPYTKALEDSQADASSYDLLFGLFREMNTPGVTPAGRFKGTPYFNGGLFADIEPFDLRPAELEMLYEASRTNWADVRPEIFGTLFEQSMDAGERHAYGAHFTSQADIAKVVGPTIVAPWRARIAGASSIGDLERILNDMYSFRVLDPACGSGNFLYVAYRELRRLEYEVLTEIDDRRRSPDRAAQRAMAYVTPDHFFGLDINPFAVEIAKVTMMLAKKLSSDELDETVPVLPLDNLDEVIVAKDALFTPWPRADVVIGNPPYLGRRKMLEELGVEYCNKLARAFPHVLGLSDYVTYWFPLAHDHIPKGGRAGFVATKTIAQTDSRKASLDYITTNEGQIFDATVMQKWSGDAAVTVSIINWIKAGNVQPCVMWVNGGDLRLEVPAIPPTLRLETDVRGALQLEANRSPKVCFQGQTPGVTKGFTVSRDEFQEITRLDPRSGRFVHPFMGGEDLLDRLGPSRYIIDLPHSDLLLAEAEAPAALAHLKKHVLPLKIAAAEKEAQRNQLARAQSHDARLNAHHAKFLASWWQLAWRRPEMLDAITQSDRLPLRSLQTIGDHLCLHSSIQRCAQPHLCRYLPSMMIIRLAFCTRRFTDFGLKLAAQPWRLA